MPFNDSAFHRIDDGRSFLFAPSGSDQQRSFGGHCSLCGIEHRIVWLDHHRERIRDVLFGAVPDFRAISGSAEVVTIGLMENSQGDYGFVFSCGQDDESDLAASRIQVEHAFITQTQALLSELDSTSTLLNEYRSERQVFEAKLRQQHIEHEQQRARARVHYQAQRKARAKLRATALESPHEGDLSQADLDRWSMQEADIFRSLKGRLRSEAKPMTDDYDALRADITDLKARRRALSDALKAHFYSAAAAPPRPSEMTATERVLHHAAYFGYVPHGIVQLSRHSGDRADAGDPKLVMALEKQTELLCGLSFRRRRNEPFQLTPSPLEVVYEDDYLAVINKPSGLLSASGRHWTTADNAQFRLSAQLNLKTPIRLVHRLDQDTSGLIMFAKDPLTHRRLSTAFMDRLVDKTYLAVLEETPKNKAGRIELPLSTNRAGRPRQVIDYKLGKPAQTEFRVLSKIQRGTLIELRPITGRTHQLRVHCADPEGLHCPIVGDDLYGRQPPQSRLYLHAAGLKFDHPRTQNIVELEAYPTFV